MKSISLTEWADLHYSAPPPLTTLRRWARNGNIYPPPEIHGRQYQVSPDAIYIKPNKFSKTAPTRPATKIKTKPCPLVEKIINEEKAGKI
ncbi:TPA: excisionase [Yersinia enterocolitica]|nr:excisionase [Yersinia enterocolitica]